MLLCALEGLDGYLCLGINILGNIYNIDTPLCTSDWELENQTVMLLSYFLNIIFAITESNTLEFPGVDRGTSSSIYNNRMKRDQLRDRS